MTKTFVKLNGFIIALCCIYHAVVGIISNLATHLVSSFVGTAGHALPMYITLISTSLVLIAGIYLEWKILLIPFVVAFLWTLYDETNGTFEIESNFKIFFIVYATACVVILAIVLKPSKNAPVRVVEVREAPIMIKNFVKLNGFIMALCCIFHGVAGIKANAYWHVDVTTPDPTTAMYMVLIATSLVFIAGICVEWKSLLIPFVISSLWTLHDETNGTFEFESYWKKFFIVYATASVVVLVIVFVIKPSSKSNCICC